MAKKILVVDDEADLRLMVSRGLAKRGYEVTGGKDGREALEQARRLLPDLIILDIFLPFMNGDDVVRALKKDEKLKQIPVILISSVPEGLDEKAAASGADAYLHKPFALEELAGLVNKFFAAQAGPVKPKIVKFWGF